MKTVECISVSAEVEMYKRGEASLKENGPHCLHHIGIKDEDLAGEEEEEVVSHGRGEGDLETLY